jgi:hypothetical protein
MQSRLFNGSLFPNIANLVDTILSSPACLSYDRQYPSPCSSLGEANAEIGAAGIS